MGGEAESREAFQRVLTSVPICLLKKQNKCYFRIVVGFQKNCEDSTERSIYIPHSASPAYISYGTFFTIHEPISIHYYELKFMFYSGFLCFYLFLFLFQGPTYVITLSLVITSPQAATVSQASLVFGHLDSFEECWSDSLQNDPQFGFVWHFSHHQTGVIGFGRKTTGAKYHSHHSLSKV